ncbi:MAG: nucleotide sugar dehydrogenase [Firmicutes bacterium]|nr:nucleotide sugar dehydrogenase [Bacillota bacterium]
MKHKILRRIKNRELIVGVIGLGYVGLPLAVEKAKAGYKTIGFDIQEQKVEAVNAGHNYIGDVIDTDLASLVDRGLLSATSDFSFVKDVDFVAICVPTPLDDYYQPDISYVKASSEEIARYLKRETIVVLESTTYPGTTEELIKPILERGSGLKCGKDFYLGFSPERVDPGNLIYKTKNTPKVVGAIGAEATEVIAAMYSSVLESQVHTVSTPAVAEMEKILENSYRNINIALANEMAIICHKMGINVWEVIEAAKTKPYGFQAFYPGPGVGGHCIPIDPYYLAWKTREYDYHTKLIETSSIINDSMPDYVVERSSRILNRFSKPLRGSQILVIGIAYKADIDDIRYSPALKVIAALEGEGSEVDYYDPYVPSYEYRGSSKTGLKTLTREILESVDLVIVTAAHSGIDYNFIQQNAGFIFDTKNALKEVKERDNIELL